MSEIKLERPDLLVADNNDWQGSCARNLTLAEQEKFFVDHLQDWWDNIEVPRMQLAWESFNNKQ